MKRTAKENIRKLSERFKLNQEAFNQALPKSRKTLLIALEAKINSGSLLGDYFSKTTTSLFDAFLRLLS